MSTYDERWVQADRHARIKADHAYELGVDNAEKASLYYGVYTTEMHAFKQLEAMRKPLPNQAEIDAASAEILNPRELRARQGVLGDGDLDAWEVKFEKYHTTANSCACPDWSVRGAFRGDITACKHMIAFRLLKATPVCPECHLPAPTGRCAHCDGETYAQGAPGPSRPWLGD